LDEHYLVNDLYLPETFLIFYREFFIPSTFFRLLK
jgi:hypothetical protein